jgi:hypothetical protein
LNHTIVAYGALIMLVRPLSMMVSLLLAAAGDVSFGSGKGLFPVQ